MCKGDLYRDCFTEDQAYRRRYRLALAEIKTMVEPRKEQMDIFDEIYTVIKKVGI